MKRIKKILAVAAAAAVLTSFGNAGAAKAAASASSCPPHGSYVDRPVLITNPWIIDTHEITITSSSGAEKIVTCNVYKQGYTIGVYCTRCNELMSTYSYDKEWHSVSYCPER